MEPQQFRVKLPPLLGTTRQVTGELAELIEQRIPPQPHLAEILGRDAILAVVHDPSREASLDGVAKCRVGFV
jgi:hypothetical protein